MVFKFLQRYYSTGLVKLFWLNSKEGDIFARSLMTDDGDSPFAIRHRESRGDGKIHAPNGGNERGGLKGGDKAVEVSVSASS